MQIILNYRSIEKINANVEKVTEQNVFRLLLLADQVGVLKLILGCAHMCHNIFCLKLFSIGQCSQHLRNYWH